MGIRITGACVHRKEDHMASTEPSRWPPSLAYVLAGGAAAASGMTDSAPSRRSIWGKSRIIDFALSNA